jgi:hypothetical protein
MAVGYRAVLRLGRGQSAVQAAEEQVRTWLSGKTQRRNSRQARVDWEGPGRYVVGTGIELLVVHADHDERTPRRLYRIDETNAGGRWVVSVYAGGVSSAQGQAQVIVVEVELVGADRQTALARVAPPAIVRALLDTYEANDGAVALTGSPNVVRAGQIDDLVDAITDRARTTPVVVALSPARDLDDAWRQVVDSLTRQSMGLSSSYVVYFDAAEELNLRLPHSHRIRSGHIRTFLPRVDLDNPSDAIRHKWLSMPTLNRSLQRGRVAEPLQRRHGEAARRRFVETELPTDVQRMVELLRRAETGTERAARVEALVAARAVEPKRPTTTAPATDAITKWRDRAVATLHRWLRVPSPEARDFDALDVFIEGKVAEVEVASDQLAEAAGEVEALQAEVGQLRRERDDLELEWAVALESQQTTDRENGILRRRLAKTQNPEDAYVAPDATEWEAPNSVELLTQWLTPDGDDTHAITARVVFTGNDDGAIEIDRRYPTGVYAGAFWQHVRALHDYAVAWAAGFNGNFHHYLTSAMVDGERCPTSQHAAKESDSVLNNPKWSAERVFPVPAGVNPDGVVFMEAHFKPTWRDTFAPRLYYYDDLANTGKIYVGYIGRHLTNTQS